MKSFIFAVTLAATLAACTTPQGTLATTPEEIARETARTIIKPIVASKLPGVPTDAAVDCVIDNASSSEILQLGESAITGSPADSTALTVSIMQRPATVQCFAQSYLTPTG